jgi:hypothetical protein
MMDNPPPTAGIPPRPSDDERDAFHALLDEWLDAEPSSPRRAELTERLAADAAGRQWLEARAALAAGPAPDGAALADQVLARLPGGSPARFRPLAELTLRAWTDARFRERVRADPRAALATAGLPLDPAVEVAVVPLDEAALPEPRRLVIPLPSAGAPAMTATEARRQLARSELGWLQGLPWTLAEEPIAAAGPAPRRAALPRPWLPVSLFAGALAASIAAIFLAGGALGDLGGSATGSGTLPVTALALLILAASLAIAGVVALRK